MVDICHAVPDDAARLADIYLDSARYHAWLDPDLYQVPDFDSIVRQFAEDLSGARSTALVAMIGGADAGFATISIVEPGTRASMIRPRIVADVGLAVRAGYRRQGVGRLLMVAAEEWAVRHQAEQMTLDCHAANEAAIGLYRRLGYETTGLFMTKRIGPAA